MHEILSRSAVFLALSGATALLAACSDSSGSGASASTTTSTTASSTTGAGGSGGAEGPGATSTSAGGMGQGGQGTGGETIGELSFLAHFDASAGELPEGLAISPDGLYAYVGFAPTGKIVKVSLDDGAVSDFGSVPQPAANAGFVLGLAVDGAGSVYVGTASFSADYKAGVYQIAAGGGAGALFAQAPALVFANGLVFRGTDLFVTDSINSNIYKVADDGTTTVWQSDSMLGGDPLSACASGLGLGANGIVPSGNAFFVANTDRASLVKIPIGAGGEAGAAESFVASDCASLGGADGLVVDQDGSLLVADNGLNRISRVTAQGAVEIVVDGGDLDSPASLALATVHGKRALLITNAAFASVQAGGAGKPGLLVLPLE